MKSLLIHALRAEAGHLRQYFPQATSKMLSGKAKLFTLNDRFDLIRTGLGMEKTMTVLALLSEPKSYDQFIHWGVSGSLSIDLPVGSLICSNHFLALNQEPIRLPPLSGLALPGLNEVTFFSSAEVVVDHSSRQQAASAGAQAVDMESYAVAKFCKQRKIPLLALRCISDQAGDSALADFREYFESASKVLQEYLLKHLLTQGN
ncbi:hypothetical protein HQ531_02980 [bacterium]|nr:hypothetical protein [bacterium]